MSKDEEIQDQRKLAAEREQLRLANVESLQSEAELNDLRTEREDENKLIRKLSDDVMQLSQQLAAAVEAIAWLNEFVVEPEYFPAEGDRYWWQEKRAALAKIGEVGK